MMMVTMMCIKMKIGRPKAYLECQEIDKDLVGDRHSEDAERVGAWDEP